MSYFAPPLNTGVIATTLPVPGAMPWMTSNDMARLSRYRQYLAFDAGKHDVGRLGIGSAAVVANYAAVFVRKGASYLMPEPVGCSVDPPDDTDVGRAVALRCERALARVGDDNDLALADLATAIDAAVLGDGAFKVTWDAAAGRVQVAPVDPQSLYVECAPDNPRAVVTVRQYRETPAGGAPVGGAGLGYTGHMHGGAELEEWTATTYRRAVNGETVWEGANPYGCIPYVVFPNSPRPHDFWGESDLTHLIGLNGQLDRRLSVLASLLELEGNPVTILENVAGSAGIEVSPGAVWELPAGATARTLQLFGGDAADVHIRTIDAIYKALHDLAEMPRSAFGDATGVVSGTALEATLQPLIQRTRRKRIIWTSALTRRARLILHLLAHYGALDLGGYTADDLPVRLAWGPIIPADRHALVADEIALTQAGLHARATAMDALGVPDAAQEAHAIAREGAGED